MKRILVPADFSPSSLAALKYACKLATKLNAGVILMHCSELLDDTYSRYKTLVIQHNKKELARTHQKLKGWQKNMANNYGIKPEICLYKNTSIIESILFSVREQKADLVIMGSYGDKGLGRKLFGSTPASVINTAPVPVITVPPHYKWSEQNEFIICIEDLIEDLEVLTPFFDIAKAHNGKVFVAVFSEETDAFELLVETRITEYLKRKISKVYSTGDVEIVHLIGKDFYRSIIECIRERKIDLLSMITYKRNLLQRIFDRSMTQKMSYKTIVPLLALHKPMIELD